MTIYLHSNGQRSDARILRVCDDGKHAIARIEGIVGDNWVEYDAQRDELSRADSEKTRERLRRAMDPSSLRFRK